MKRQDGFALPLALIIIVVVSLLLLSSSLLAISDRANTANDKAAQQAEEVAMAGFVKYRVAAFQGFRYFLANPSKYTQTGVKYAACGNTLTAGLDLGRDGLSNGTTYPTPDSNDLQNGSVRSDTIQVGDATGNVSLLYSVSGSNIILRSTGNVNGSRAIVQGTLTAKNSGTFSNAIFTGSGGQSGKFINGNVEVYGSIYVQGNSTATYAVDTNGGFKQHNYYTKETLKAITDIKTDSNLSFLKLQATEQKDLCASLTAQNGKIKVSGSATIGDSAPPDGFSGNLKGIYAGTTSSDLELKDGSYSADQIGPFNLTPAPVMPTLDSNTSVDLKRSPANVQAAFNGVSPLPSWRDVMRKDAELNGLIVDASVNPLKLTPNQTGCNINSAISAGTLTFNTTPISCMLNDKGFTYTLDSTTGKWVLDINGTLDLRGLNVAFTKSVVVRYKGQATMLVEKDMVKNKGGNVTVADDILPYQSFPDQDVLGLMAEDNLTITGDTQSTAPNCSTCAVTKQQVVAGIFYAGNTFAAQNGPVVLGSVMGNTVDLSNGANGGGTAKIVQVPGLEYNLPPGLAYSQGALLASFSVNSYERK